MSADPELIPANQRSVAIGGLMRCCTQTLMEDERPYGPGALLACRWCSSSMRVRPDGVWEWVRKEP